MNVTADIACSDLWVRFLLQARPLARGGNFEIRMCGVFLLPAGSRAGQRLLRRCTYQIQLYNWDAPTAIYPVTRPSRNRLHEAQKRLAVAPGSPPGQHLRICGYSGPFREIPVDVAGCLIHCLWIPRLRLLRVLCPLRPCPSALCSCSPLCCDRLHCLVTGLSDKVGCHLNHDQAPAYSY